MGDFKATAEPSAFEEAVRWFRERFPITEALLDVLKAYAEARAWTIAEVAQLDMVLEAHQVILRGLEESWDMKRTGKELRKVLTNFSEARCETIARTNIQKANMAGRWEQLNDPDITDVFPYRKVDAILDGRTSDVCRGYDGITLPYNDPWWLTHWPPYHHRCRTLVRTATEDEYADVPADKRVANYEKQPSGDFGKAPVADKPWEPELTKYPPRLAGIFEDKRLAAASGE